ncbi:MAG: VWA domain-containing protein [Phycisphaerae bacterium]
MRRGGVVVQVAVMSTVIMGMGALAIDVGAMYTAKVELQAAADAAALAAAGRLMGDDTGFAPEVVARQVAQDYAALNQANGHPIHLSHNDVEMGRAEYNPATNRFEFVPSNGFYDAVKVTTRLSDSNANGSLALTFANIFGVGKKELWADAVATLIPRDIAVVIDLSGSMNYDSQTMYWSRNDGGYSNLRDVWAALNGPAPSRPYEPGSELETEYAGDTGPTYGVMTQWGDPLLPGSYSASSDPGLKYLRKGQNASSSTFGSSLSSAGYNTAERAALLDGSPNDDNSDRWRNRAGVLLGLATWRSGKSGSSMGYGGDGDNYIENNEIQWHSRPSFANWHWRDYINFVEGSYTSGGSDITQFRRRYGLKTLTDFMLSNKPRYEDTDVLWQTPEQPLQAVKDALQVLSDTIDALDSPDQMSLETFGQTTRHEVNLTMEVQDVPDKLYQRQAAHIDSYTNIGGGLWRGISELESHRARGAARKVIVLMSDGEPNVNEWGNYSTSGGSGYALAAADECADRDIIVYTVSVGYGADRALMQEIANKTNGQEFFASGSPEEYTEELEHIFRSLGGKRPVALIE